MDATFADRSPARWIARLGMRPWTVFLVETSVLSVVMAAPFFLLDYGWGAIVVGLVFLGYILWTAMLIRRREKTEAAPPLRVRLLAVAVILSAGFMFAGLAISVVLGWISWAYRDAIFPAPARGFAVAAVIVVVPAMVIALIAMYPGREDGPAAAFRAGFRRRGFAVLWTSFNSDAASVLSLLCLVVFAAGAAFWLSLAPELNFGGGPLIWELAMAVPVLPLALITGAAMLSAYRRSFANHLSTKGLVRACTGDAGAPLTLVGGLSILCGSLITLYVVLYAIHFGIVLALSSTAGVSATAKTAETIEEWAEVQRGDGRTETGLAVILNEYGGWNPESPEAGIPALFPELSEAMPAGGNIGEVACNITVAAAVTAERTAPDLTYCIRTACPSPVAWNAPDTVMLASSHSSGNRQWVKNYFIDFFAEGRAPAPGGYCTTDGELADSYQG